MTKEKRRQAFVAVQMKMCVNKPGQQGQPVGFKEGGRFGNRDHPASAGGSDLFAAHDDDSIAHRRSTASVNQCRADDGNRLVCSRFRYFIYFAHRDGTLCMRNELSGEYRQASAGLIFSFLIIVIDRHSLIMLRKTMAGDLYNSPDH